MSLDERIIGTKATNQRQIMVSSYCSSWQCTRKCDLQKTSANEYFGQDTPEILEFLPEGILLDKEKQKIVLQAVWNLPTDQKAVMMLYYYSRLSMTEVALAMDVSQQTVHLKLLEGRTSLTQKLSGGLDLGEPILCGPNHLPVLTRIFYAEAALICTPQIREQIWNNIRTQLNAEE